jgi:HEAT repeat protein
MPWEAIKYVGSGLTLAAFIVAAIAWILKSKSEERERLIDLAKEDERAELVRDALEFFRVDTAGLTKAQQYQLALEQIRGRSQRFKIVAVVVCIVAVLGTAIAIYALTRPESKKITTTTNGDGAPPQDEAELTNKIREAQAQLTNTIIEAQALLGDARLQSNARDYAAAWKTVERATALNPYPDEARKEQVDIAMGWLRGWRSAPQAIFDLIDNKLVVCLEQAAARADGVRAADIHAHLGWANYLRRIENVPVEEEFKKAVEADSTNPFAHAMWGYWLIAQAHQTKEGKAHFESAFKSGREKEFVRQLQLDTWQRYKDSENSLELILVFDDMRKKGEKRTVDSRQSLFSYAYANPDSEFLQRFKSILPAAEHLATFQWLTEGFGSEESVTKDFFLAQLTEAAGDPAKALTMYRILLAQPTSIETEIKEGINRTKPSAEKGVSETSLIIAQAKTGDVATRAKLIRSLARTDIDVSEALPALVSWAQDSDREILAAACETLVQLGRAAVPKVVPLLSSDKRRDVMNAATILGRIGLEPKLVVPALGKALENPDAEVREKVIEALENFGPDAEPAVAMLLQTLTKTVQTDLQKQIAYTLGEIGPAAKDAVPQLIELVKSSKDRDGFLNVSAAEALGKIGPAAATAVPTLINALKSDDVRLPTIAAEALGNIGAEARMAIPALIEAMKVTEKEHRDNFAEPLGKIAEALANRGDTSSLPALRKAMQSLEAANMEPKYITPVREAMDVLKEKVSRNEGK